MRVATNELRREVGRRALSAAASEVDEAAVAYAETLARGEGEFVRSSDDLPSGCGWETFAQHAATVNGDGDLVEACMQKWLAHPQTRSNLMHKDASSATFASAPSQIEKGATRCVLILTRSVDTCEQGEKIESKDVAPPPKTSTVTREDAGGQRCYRICVRV